MEEEQEEKDLELREEMSTGEMDDPEERFNQFMFGSTWGTARPRPVQGTFNKGSQHYIDIDQLMMNIDTLVESVRNLKPLFQKVTPFVEQLWKKK